MTGLSNNDCVNLMNILDDLVDKGCTIIFIEHNKISRLLCDYIIEVGSSNGINGGKIINKKFKE